MKDELVIATFNWQNKYHPYQTLKDKTDCYSFIKFIMENGIDILGTQETVSRNLKLCRSVLFDYGYDVYGTGRFGSIGHIYPVSLTNETNSIVTRLQPSSRLLVRKMPWLGSPFPRILTILEFDNLVFLNTHLDNVNPKVKKNQLQCIYELISDFISGGFDVILTGDFNMTVKNKNFSDFIAALEQLGINRVDNDIATCRGIKKPIDHVFISNNWEVLKRDVVKVSISDHKSIIVKVKRRNKNGKEVKGNC